MTDLTPLPDRLLIEPLVAAYSKRAVSLAAKSKLPLVRQYLARRIAEK